MGLLTAGARLATRNRFLGLVLALAATIAVAACSATAGDRSTDAGSTTHGSWGFWPASTSSPVDVTPVPSAGSHQPSAGVQTPDDAIGGARAGDCFALTITGSQVDLSRATCQPGAYKLLKRYDNTTDSGLCNSLANFDFSVTNAGRRIVLCLTYQFRDDAAAHAQNGTCVGQPDGSDRWYTYSCQRGIFKVIGWFRGTTDHAKCGTSPFYNYGLSYTIPGNSQSDILQCLSFQYGSDAGYARKGNCMTKAGPDTDFTLSFPGDGTCAGTNVVITGRDNSFSSSGAKAFCGNDGYYGQNVARYPELSYTVCWRPI